MAVGTMKWENIEKYIKIYFQIDFCCYFYILFNTVEKLYKFD